jgi:hypothetical protein
MIFNRKEIDEIRRSIRLTDERVEKNREMLVLIRKEQEKYRAEIMRLWSEIATMQKLHEAAGTAKHNQGEKQ